jgi:DNA-binding beta-propeller fold protein YncE
LFAPSAELYATRGLVLGMKVSPNGKFLAVGVFAFQPNEMLLIFSIGADGTLTQVSSSPFQIGGVSIHSFEFNRNNNLLFLGEHTGPPTTDVFSFSSDGMVSPIPGSPFIQTTGNIGNGSQIVVLSPNEKLLFTSNQSSDTVTAWRVAPNGSLALVEGSSFPVGDREPVGMAINKAGSLLYVANTNEPFQASISVFRVANDGFLTLVPSTPIRTGQGPGLRSIAVYPAKDDVTDAMFNICIQSSSQVIRINSTTGDYQFTDCNGITLTGTGVLGMKGCTITLQHNAPDRRIQAMVNTCQKRGTASVQVFSPRRTFHLSDLDITNGCGCN